MTAFRNHLKRLDAADDVVRVDQRVHWIDEAPAIAAEAARENGPAVLFEETPGAVRLVSGAYGGPDRMQLRKQLPWTRLALALGRAAGTNYTDLLSTLEQSKSKDARATRGALLADSVSVDLHSLGLPAVRSDDTPTVTLGLLAVSVDNETMWAPIHCSVRGSDRLRATIPAALASSVDDGASASVALGVPAAALVAANVQWAGRARFGEATSIATALDDVTVADTYGPLVPASTELLLNGRIAPADAVPQGPREAWEYATRTTPVELEVTGIAARDDPVVPFSPIGTPLADDVHLTGTSEAARLYTRVNNYWGVRPVEWIALPAETRLGLCLVSSDILYAGFEWQLSNTLFSFSQLFDKVLVLDESTPADNFGRVFDDMWVKAPPDDWEFSESDAPAPAAPAYRQDGTTGSQMFINATWDPHWDEEYIAPRVDFETSFPENVREFVLENWDVMGFEKTPQTDADDQ